MSAFMDKYNSFLWRKFEKFVRGLSRFLSINSFWTKGNIRSQTRKTSRVDFSFRRAVTLCLVIIPLQTDNELVSEMFLFLSRKAANIFPLLFCVWSGSPGIMPLPIQALESIFQHHQHLLLPGRLLHLPLQVLPEDLIPLHAGVFLGAVSADHHQFLLSNFNLNSQALYILTTFPYYCGGQFLFNSNAQASTHAWVY